MGKNKALPLKSRLRQLYPQLQVLFNVMIAFLARELRESNKMDTNIKGRNQTICG
jgi:hypothetical protein